METRLVTEDRAVEALRELRCVADVVAGGEDDALYPSIVEPLDASSGSNGSSAVREPLTKWQPASECVFGWIAVQ